jgi:hypothetical protein
VSQLDLWIELIFEPVEKESRRTKEKHETKAASSKQNATTQSR